MLQRLVISASARFTEICRGLGRYAPDTPPKSRDFRKVLVLLQSYIYTLLVPFFYHQIIHHFHQLPEPLAVYFNILLFPILFKSFFIHKSNYLGNYNSVGQFPVLRLALRRPNKVVGFSCIRHIIFILRGLSLS